MNMAVHLKGVVYHLGDRSRRWLSKRGTPVTSLSIWAQWPRMSSTSPNHSTCDVDASRFVIRPGTGSDIVCLIALHDLLPVDYATSFFTEVLTEPDRLTFLACKNQAPFSAVGFVTARLVPLREVSHNDKQSVSKLLGGQDTWSTGIMYLLTLAVDPLFRRQGLAEELVQRVVEVRTPI